MPPEEHESDQTRAARESLQLAFTVLAQVGGLSILMLLAAIFGGLWLDRVFDTRRLFTVLLLVASFPLSLYIIYRVALSAVAKVSKPGVRLPRAKKEDRIRDDDSRDA